ncbi:cysteine desulfurase [Prosthecobacter fusiformis]|uniref:Cysteine desulfurase n=1 Tax=Prosthecobacter fusiformis TaxID=48464 RepID=A0A4R7RZS4_9BACT|nr:cysteine desulfurase family protein [Prosthecobacter fusiformis]TDU70656.1 cysteine desulfurase [Prosthecobacter fusiformis]
MIDLDANATTQPDPAVIEAMLPFLTQHYGNPSAAHAAGRRARRAVDAARQQVAVLIGAEPQEIVFTSGATESISSVHLSAYQTGREHPLLIISAVEHAATQACAERWKAQGGRVKIIPVFPNGLVNLEALESALEPGKTALVSLLWANNETGVVQPMAEVVSMAHAAGALVHADAVQMGGKLPVDVRKVGMDYLSMSGHKMHGPKGIGILFVNRHAPFHPLIIGGGQEYERRSGTENVPGIVAMGKAAELAQQHVQSPESQTSMARLRDHLEQMLQEALPEIVIHGREVLRLPNTSSVYFPGVDAAGLIIRLDQKGIACSGGSACHSASLHPSHVLEAMGYDARHAGSTVRFSLSRLTTNSEVEKAGGEIIAAVHHLRAQWDPEVVVTMA